MNRVVYKYRLEPITQLFIGADAQVLDVATQDGEPHLWALLDPDGPAEMRTFHAYGTGHPIVDADQLHYIGTCHGVQGSLVFHIFEAV